MKRASYNENTLERIAKWRDINHFIAIRSTFVVGFLAKAKPTSKNF